MLALLPVALGSVGYLVGLVLAIGSYVYFEGGEKCLGFLWMLWDSQNQTWHDKIANSLVVQA